jgi:hypothetical protein
MLREEMYDTEVEDKTNRDYSKEIILYEECMDQVEEHIKDLHVFLDGGEEHD